MPPSRSRRAFLASATGTVAALAGCYNTDDIGLVLVNEDDENHSVAVWLEENGTVHSANLDEGGTHKVKDAIGISDTGYDETLTVRIDARTAGRRVVDTAPDTYRLVVTGPESFGVEPVYDD